MNNTNKIFKIITICFACFFIYVGCKKFIPSKKKSLAVKTEQINSTIKESKISPFVTAMKVLKQSGFLKMIGVLQIISGLLMLIGRTRLIGVLLLLPITFNIFTLHLFLDNRVDELIKTGSILLLNIAILFPYKIRFRDLLIFKSIETN